MSSRLKIIGLVVLCVLMFILGRKSVAEQEITTIERVDTVVVEKPMPYKVEVVRKVSVPVYVPTPADTVVNNRVDTVRVQVPVNIESREYRDSTYRAVVSGPVIGGLGPSLDQIDIYSRTTTSIIEKKNPLFSPYVSGGLYLDGKGVNIGGGLFIRDKIGVGAEVVLHNGKWNGLVKCTYKW